MTARLSGWTAGLVLGVSSVVWCQAPTVPVGTTSAKAKELVALLQSKKLDPPVYAAHADVDGRFVAVLLIPGVQLLVVAAQYERPTDIDYRIYNKDFMGAYSDLRASVLSKNRVVIEDAFCDGLVAQPGKDQLVSDSASIESGKHVFDGVFADPKKRDPKKISLEDYSKNFSSADQQYSTLLDLLLTQLKK